MIIYVLEMDDEKYVQRAMRSFVNERKDRKS